MYKSSGVGSVLFMAVMLYMFGPDMTGSDTANRNHLMFSSSGVDDTNGTSATSTQFQVFAFAKRDISKGRFAMARSAEFCAEGYMDMHKNESTPKVMSSIYGKILNRAMKEEKISSHAELLDAAQKEVIAKFKYMKNAGFTEQDREYGALGLVNINFKSFDACVYRNFAKFIPSDDGAVAQQ